MDNASQSLLSVLLPETLFSNPQLPFFHYQQLASLPTPIPCVSYENDILPASETSEMNENLTVDALSARVPSDPLSSAAPNLPDLLRQLLQLCRNKWIADFLFTSDPIHLRWLSQADFHLGTVQTRISASRIEPTHLRQGTPTEMDDNSYLHGDFLYIPSVTIGNITLGFGIMEAVFSVGDAPPSESSSQCRAIRTNFRFSRDSSNDVLLEVHDLLDQDSVVISYSRSESATVLRSFKARFHRRQLLAVIHEEQTPLFFDRVLLALQSFQTELQSKECPACTASATGCSCPRALPSPSHPFDHAQFTAGMNRSVGSFEGVANKARFESGTQIKHTTLGSKTVVQAVKDRALMQRMISWAASQRISKATLEPMGSHAPTDFDQNAIERRGNQNHVANPVMTKVQCAPQLKGLTDKHVGNAFLAPSSANFTTFEKPLQPISTVMGADTGEESEAISAPKQMNEKELKVEIRKQKNRESALRSNRRKKAMKDALALELKTCQELSEHLRKREAQLRQENLRLRRSFVE